MIAVDTNLLVYSHRSDSPHHRPARELLEGLRGARAPWAIPWPCIHEFVSIVTHPKVFKHPTPLTVAFDSVDAWFAGGNLNLIGESARLPRQAARPGDSGEGARAADSRRTHRRSLPAPRCARAVVGGPGFRSVPGTEGAQPAGVVRRLASQLSSALIFSGVAAGDGSRAPGRFPRGSPPTRARDAG